MMKIKKFQRKSSDCFFFNLKCLVRSRGSTGIDSGVLVAKNLSNVIFLNNLSNNFMNGFFCIVEQWN